MLFNSIEYLLFLPIVFLIYWAIGYAKIGDTLKLRLQNTFVVVASYVFYGWWDWRFLILIAFTSLCSWLSGILINSTKTQINPLRAINTDKEEVIKNTHSTSTMPDGPRGLERNHPQTLTSELAASVDANTPNMLPECSTLNAYENTSDSSDSEKCEKQDIDESRESREESVEWRVKRGKFWLWLNIAINIGILAVFKYYDFFVSEFGAMLGINTSSLLLRVILPVGISFYTFQALSYSIDVYRGNIKPTKDIIAFFTFISFFPQLVAGPIERATNLLPQFLQNRKFSYDQGVDGMRQILWGLFKKIVIADNCATYVDQVWSTYGTQSGSTLLLAAVLFTFQIYGDFSGYSDIAIGTAKLFGIKLMRNFNNPYFSRDIAEFWRRWHISLTSWFRDYVYIPLGGSRNGQWRTIANTFVVFMLCAIWHGANWTYMVWGLYHVMLFIPLILIGRKREARPLDLDSLRTAFKMLLTFALVTIGLIIFRAPTVADAWGYVSAMCSSGWGLNYIGGVSSLAFTAIGIAVMMGMEWIQRGEEHGLVLAGVASKVLRYAIYVVLIAMMLWNGEQGDAFIYFQF